MLNINIEIKAFGGTLIKPKGKVNLIVENKESKLATSQIMKCVILHFKEIKKKTVIKDNL